MIALQDNVIYSDELIKNPQTREIEYKPLDF